MTDVINKFRDEDALPRLQRSLMTGNAHTSHSNSFEKDSSQTLRRVHGGRHEDSFISSMLSTRYTLALWSAL